MRIHVLQHVAFEGPALISKWARDRRFPLTTTRFYEANYQLPPAESVDLLFVLGGPMAAYDTGRHPWLADEKAFIRACIEGGSKVLGICLGAQLCADVLGAAVFPNDQKEIGWLPIEKMAHTLVSGFTQPQMVFHWHGDTFDLPPGAVHLASSAACENQMFLWHDQVLGIQFHLEMEQPQIEALIAHCGAELARGVPTIQSAAQIRSNYKHLPQLRTLLEDLLARFVL